MRAWIVVICTVIALQSMVVRSETWSCSYTHNDKQEVFIRVREEGGFRNPTSEDPWVERVLTEHDLGVHLYDTVGEFGSYFATLLDKENKRFWKVGLTAGGPTNVISGPCEVY